ncbi:MAG TPA: hypothetical protein VEJ89_12285 [Myxococcaceae bacterium]|jgi:hypothetical protein|nr:hypothetical protein [Myxococcaceae bacterium]
MPTQPQPPKRHPALEGATATVPERVPVRTREGRITLSAWRMNVTSPSGPGAIVLVETNVGAVFRGEGLFLGWNQDDLGTAYRALIPKPAADEPSMDGPQLG